MFVETDDELNAQLRTLNEQKDRQLAQLDDLHNKRRHAALLKYHCELQAIEQERRAAILESHIQAALRGKEQEIAKKIKTNNGKRPFVTLMETWMQCRSKCDQSSLRIAGVDVRLRVGEEELAEDLAAIGLAATTN